MSLLSICQNAANNLGVTAPTSIIGNIDPAAARLLQLARREGANLSTRANWAALVVENVFVANGGTSDFSLPADFRSMVNDTLWDRSRRWQMRGAMTPQQWQLYKSSIIGRATIERRWRIRVSSGSPAGAPATFDIDPPVSSRITSPLLNEDGSPILNENGQPILVETNTGGGVFVYEYVSKNWVTSTTASQLAGATPDTRGSGYVVGDIIVPDHGATPIVQSPFLVVTGIEDATTGSIGDLEVTQPGQYTATPGNPVGQFSTTGSGAGATFNLTYCSLTQDDWTADTDTSLLDEDLIELGVIWRLARRIGLAYDEERSEYLNQVGQAVARDGGTQTLHLAPVDRLTLVGPYNVQEGSFPGA
jgi:hypothetical protein